MRALIFGGAGMLGQAVAAEFTDRDFETRILSHAQADITDAAAVGEQTIGFAPDLIVNCAAFTAVDAAEDQRELAMAVNGAAVEHLAAAAARADARLLHISSDYVFDGRSRAPYAEDAVTNPLSIYGRSKLAGELAALTYGKSLVLRTSWLFGPGGANFVRTMAALMTERKEPLRVVGDQIGCPTYTRYLARAIGDLASRDVSGVLHYRNDPPVSWHEFALRIARHRRSRLPVEEISTAEMPRPAVRPAYSVLAVGRIESLLDRNVEDWEAGLMEYLDILRTEGMEKET